MIQQLKTLILYFLFKKKKEEENNSLLILQLLISVLQVSTVMVPIRSITLTISHNQTNKLLPWSCEQKHLALLSNAPWQTVNNLVFFSMSSLLFKENKLSFMHTFPIIELQASNKLHCLSKLASQQNKIKLQIL